jgi:hypothetical protein
MQKIGKLFLLRTNINSVGSVLDSPVSTNLDLNLDLFSLTYICIGGILGESDGIGSLACLWTHVAVRASQICNPSMMQPEVTWKSHKG